MPSGLCELNKQRAHQNEFGLTAASALGLKLLSLEVRAPGELDKAMESATRGRVDALMVLRDQTTYLLRKRIVALI